MASRGKLRRGNSKQAAKRTKISCPCRVCNQECRMEEESIQCDSCQSWLHQDCVSMSVSQYMLLSEKTYFQFFCRSCSLKADGKFNCEASLSRISSCAPDVGKMRQQAESEHNLLTFYNIILPSLSVPVSSDVKIDKQSVSMLHDHSRWLLYGSIHASQRRWRRQLFVSCSVVCSLRT